jgi:hypothetical protein
MPEPKAKPDPKPATQPVGSVWEIRTKDAVKVLHPRGTEYTFGSSDGVVRVVLDTAGTWTAGTETVEAV